MDNIVDKIGIGEKNKLTLKKKSAKIYLWFEDRDKWFVNMKNGTAEDSVWILRTELENRIQGIIQLGYSI